MIPELIQIAFSELRSSRVAITSESGDSISFEEAMTAAIEPVEAALSEATSETIRKTAGSPEPLDVDGLQTDEASPKARASEFREPAILTHKSLEDMELGSSGAPRDADQSEESAVLVAVGRQAIATSVVPLLNLEVGTASTLDANLTHEQFEQAEKEDCKPQTSSDRTSFYPRHIENLENSEPFDVQSEPSETQKIKVSYEDWDTSNSFAEMPSLEATAKIRRAQGDASLPDASLAPNESAQTIDTAAGQLRPPAIMSQADANLTFNHLIDVPEGTAMKADFIEHQTDDLDAAKDPNARETVKKGSYSEVAGVRSMLESDANKTAIFGHSDKHDRDSAAVEFRISAPVAHKELQHNTIASETHVEDTSREHVMQLGSAIDGPAVKFEPVQPDATGSTSGIAATSPFPIAQPLSGPGSVGPKISLTMPQVFEVVEVGVQTEMSGEIEIELRPLDLGRMKLTFRQDSQGLSITVDAEWPETVDQIKRHIDQLSTELRLNETAPRFRFESNGFGQGSREGHAGQRQARGLRGGAYGEEPSEASSIYKPQNVSDLSSGNVDIRA